jgi:anti-sigma regulatory factor (Ser/Thr protein kinase)
VPISTNELHDCFLVHAGHADDGANRTALAERGDNGELLVWLQDIHGTSFDRGPRRRIMSITFQGVIGLSFTGLPVTVARCYQHRATSFMYRMVAGTGFEPVTWRLAFARSLQAELPRHASFSVAQFTIPAHQVNNNILDSLQYCQVELLITWMEGYKMAVSADKSKEIEEFILTNVEKHPADIGRLTTEKFGLSRVAVVKRLQGLKKVGLLDAKGNTKARRYELKIIGYNKQVLQITPALTEDDVWLKEIRPQLDGVKDNVLGICAHGVTEMFNNVIDHSESTTASVMVTRDAAKITINIRDYGIGIFDKIQKALNLSDPHHAILELTKGKVTTDKSRHTGEGIFFTSRMFDLFIIRSGELVFTRLGASDDWLMESDSAPIKGTDILLRISPNATQTTQETFNKFRAEFDEFGFSKTNIPLILLKYEGEQLISRSQAKRLMARVDQFREVILDFKGITSIGQAFADEVFRIYCREHPLVHVYPINASEEVLGMIKRVMAEGGEDFESYCKKLREARGVK